jgi:hypothetical protein
LLRGQSAIYTRQKYHSEEAKQQKVKVKVKKKANPLSKSYMHFY